MTRQKLVFSLISIIISVLSVSGQVDQRTTILISLDGFRYDYIDKYKPANISEIAKEGVRAKWLKPSFPTKTFPNHYTIATGLYPQNHGIVENTVWDFNTRFSMSIREEVQNGRWWLGEPIWVTAAKQGVATGSFFFPGTEAEIGGSRPKIWKEYEHKLPFEKRVDTVLSWFDLPQSERPIFFTLYFDEPDTSGHNFGPISPETKAAVLKVDSMIGRLTSGLKNRGVYKDVNIVILSDHGMAAINTKENHIALDQKIDIDKAEQIIYGGEIVQIFPKAGETKFLMSQLDKVKNIKCWEKGKLPARLHYNTGKRVAPVICSPDIGWTANTAKYFENLSTKSDWGKIRGVHGYDNRHKDMRAIFVAKGPAFKRGKIVRGFNNVDVYSLLCAVLRIKPSPNDGNFDHVKGMLKVDH